MTFQESENEEKLISYKSKITWLGSRVGGEEVQDEVQDEEPVEIEIVEEVEENINQEDSVEGKDNNENEYTAERRFLDIVLPPEEDTDREDKGKASRDEASVTTLDLSREDIKVVSSRKGCA